jgi:NitT/TauT family transport system substrate-binding protein
MADLKGRSIAISAPGSFPDMFARVAMAKFNLSPADVVLAAVGGDRDRYTALIGGVVDAAVVSNEYLPLPMSRNFRMLVTGNDAGPNFLRVCMFSTGKVLAERREDAIRYLMAQCRALRYAITHRDETLKLTFESSNADPDDPRPAFVFDDAVNTRAVAPDLPIPVEKIAWMQDQLVALGQIPMAGDIAKMVDTEIRAEAIRRVGR